MVVANHLAEALIWSRNNRETLTTSKTWQHCDVTIYPATKRSLDTPPTFAVLSPAIVSPSEPAEWQQSRMTITSEM
jgi:hypothetical protein